MLYNKLKDMLDVKQELNSQCLNFHSGNHEASQEVRGKIEFFVSELLEVTSYDDGWILFFGKRSIKVIKAIAYGSQSGMFKKHRQSESMIETEYYFVCNLIEEDIEWGLNIEHCFFKSDKIIDKYLALLEWFRPN